MCVHVSVILLEVDTRSQLPPPPRTNLLQTKTKRIQRRGFSACLFFFFQGCQPLLFKDLTLALQSNKNLFGKLIRLSKLFRFLMQLNVKSSIFLSLTLKKFTNMTFRVSFLPSLTRGPLLEQVQRGELLTFFYWGYLILLLRKIGDACVTAPWLHVLSQN